MLQYLQRMSAFCYYYGGKSTLTPNTNTMELSIVVAKIAAVIYISVGLGGLIGQISFSKILESYIKSEGLTYFTGFVAVILGMLLVLSHNVWAQNWTTLITIIGWAILIKGVMILAFPKFMSFFKSWVVNSQIIGLVMLVLGLVFGYFGFIA